MKLLVNLQISLIWRNSTMMFPFPTGAMMGMDCEAGKDHSIFFPCQDNEYTSKSDISTSAFLERMKRQTSFVLRGKMNKFLF